MTRLDCPKTCTGDREVRDVVHFRLRRVIWLHRMETLTLPPRWLIWKLPKGRRKTNRRSNREFSKRTVQVRSAPAIGSNRVQCRHDCPATFRFSCKRNKPAETVVAIWASETWTA